MKLLIIWYDYKRLPENGKYVFRQPFYCLIGFRLPEKYLIMCQRINGVEFRCVFGWHIAENHANGGGA